MKFGIILLCAMLGCAVVESVDEVKWHSVALDDAGCPGAQPHLMSGGDFTYPDAPADLDATVAFGQSVVFGFDGLNPEARYRLRIMMVSDGPRAQNLIADETVLESEVTLEKYAPIEKLFDLAPDIYSDGTVFVRSESLEGPNAVIGAIGLLSTDPTTLTPIPEPPVPEFTMPRLSPRPDTVAGVASPILSLDGTWRFNPDPTDYFFKSDTDRSGWAKIKVPGQWTQQGFSVEKGKAAAYSRSFTIPEDWKGFRIKLRCNGVYSESTIFINGEEAGRHQGGFTPFELDVTDLAKPGINTICLAVKSHSLADTLASGNQYAAHDLGGIPRSLRLFALPKINVAGFNVFTRFDDAFKDGTISVGLTLANEGDQDVKSLLAILTLKSCDAEESPSGEITQEDESLPLPLIVELPGASTVEYHFEMNIQEPRKWHAESPHLYALTMDLHHGFESLQQVKRRFGFRQVEVRGDQLLVNGKPVKLRGVCRHEAHPLSGRSLSPEDWRRDAELFKAANCNYIRTSHYPPDEAFIDACDELGLFVEEEAPLCWVGHGANPTWKTWDPQDDQYFAYIQQCILEMIQRDRNHPSVICWSLANESAWGRNWKFASLNAAEADPTRPRTFHDQCYGGYNNHGSGMMPVANFHYPGPDGAVRAREIDRPLLFGEYSHLNAYNRFELVTDPGVRDAWGRGFHRMWESIQAEPGMLGGAIWSGIDDSFFLPDGRVVGYGTWGPIDGWRREKPEYWHVKKTYSPVRVRVDEARIVGDTWIVPVENRHDATNLRALDITWKSGSDSGRCEVDVPPRSEGTLTLPVSKEELLVEVRDAAGLLIDSYRIDAHEKERSHPVVRCAEAPELLIDHDTGKITGLTVAGKPFLLNGPDLMILPLNAEGGTQMTGENQDFPPDTATCTGWRLDKIEIDKQDDRVAFSVKGRYDDAEGEYTLTLHDHGELELDYAFTCTNEINPRQIGMVFTLPIEFDTLTWKRDGLWTVYPADHIARLEGRTDAFPIASRTGPAGPAVLPQHPYAHDTNDMGSNDFRSTKENIREAALLDENGEGVHVFSDAKHHVRAWVDGSRIRLLVASYNNPGAERFFRSHAAREDRPLKPGDRLEGKIRLFMGQVAQ